MAVPNALLQNGMCVPMIGLGTWRSAPDVVRQAVRDAIDVGYRHIDCAHIYGNEEVVGAAIEDKISQGVVRREDLFITSKLWNTFHHPDVVSSACAISLNNLRLNYLDNYLIHWPMAFKDGDELYPKDAAGKMLFSKVDFVDTWRAMEQLVDAGLCRTIGISNFNQTQIERILNIARIPPTTLQIECHPYLNQCGLMKFCKENHIVVTAYSPLGSPHSPYVKPGEHKLLEHPKVVALARVYERTPAQILVRYQVQRGNIVIPRSINKEHMLANLTICDFALDPRDIQELNELDFNGRYMTMAAAAGHPYHPFAEEESQKQAP